MKKLIISVLAVCAGLMIGSMPAMGGTPLETAQEALENLGANPAHLECSYSTDNLSVFKDSYEKCYIVLADKRFRPVLGGDLVLAYSTESSLNGGSDDFIYEIVRRYDEQLAQTEVPFFCRLRRLLARRRAVRDYIAPMDRKFNQGYPYNKYFPVE